MNKLILDGVEYNLSDSLVAKLKEEIAINDAVRRDKTVFDRVVGMQYFFTDKFGVVRPYIDGGDKTDDELYAAANYCRDEELMEQRALHETLNRLLWRYSETHGGDAPWDGSHVHFYICYTEIGPQFCTGEFRTGEAYRHKEPCGTVYFKDKLTAQSAIEEVVNPFLAEHPEFVW